MRTGPRIASIPATALRDVRLKPLDLRVLLELGTGDANQGWRTVVQDEMAFQCSATRPSISASLKRLLAGRYLEMRKRGGRSENNRPVNEYRVRFDLTDEEVAAAATAISDMSPTPDMSSQDDTKRVSSRRHVVSSRQVSQSHSKEDSLGDNLLPGSDVVVVDDVAVARARERRPDDFERICAAAGPGLADPAKEPQLLLSAPIIGHWISSGADVELDVIPVVRALTAEARASPIKSLRFFNEPVRQHAAERLAEPEPIKPAKGANGGRGRQEPEPDCRTLVARAAAKLAAEGL